jgi:hypothetical protein
MKRISIRTALALVVTSVVSAAPRNLPPPKLTSAQQAALDTLVERIKWATRSSFVRDDWTGLAQLYPPGVLDCWTGEFTEDKFAFLSRPGIPDDATHELGRIENYHLGGNRDYSKLQATHYLVISYEHPYLARCGNIATRARPAEHFYLRQRGDSFELRHECPGRRDVLPPGASMRIRMLSTGYARALAERMSPAERLDIRRRLLTERPIPLNTVLGLQTRYQISDAESYLLIDRICELTTP